MTYREKLMKLSIGKVVELMEGKLTFYGHVVGFEYRLGYALDTGVIVRFNDGTYTVDLDKIYL